MKKAKSMRKHLPVFILLTITLFCLLSACNRDSEETKVKKAVISMQKATEEKDLRTMLSHISKSYKDPQGNTYEGIKNLILFYFFKHEKISVLLPDIVVTADTTSAFARFEAILSSRTGSSSEILPEALGAYRFEVSFEKDTKEQKWKINSARWQRIGESEPGKE